MIYKQFPKWRKYKYFYIYAILITVLELVYMTLAIFQIRNLFLDYFYKPIEFFFLGMFLQNLLITKKLKFLILICTSILILFLIWNAIYGNGFFNYNAYGNIISSLYLTMFSFYILIVMLKNKYFDNLYKNSVFLIVLAVFLFFLTSLLSDLLLNFSYNQMNFSFAMFLILIFTNFIKTMYLLLYIRGILLIKK